jgi:hypothetical protein
MQGMDVCVRLFCVLYCPVCKWRPCDRIIVSPSSRTACVKMMTEETEEKARAQEMAVEPLMNEMTEY